jgi:four helix bundle protein
MSDFKKLQVWHKAHRLSLDLHAAATSIRGSNHSTLRSQLIRAGESIPQNIVEGSGEQTPLEFARFLRSSINSAHEVEYHVLVARERKVLGFKDFEDLTERTIEVRKMLYGLLRRIEGRDGDEKDNNSSE